MIKEIEKIVKEAHKNDSTGHSWDHIDRVRNLALKISDTEGGDKEVIEISALLHDLIDDKLGFSEWTIAKIKQLLNELNLPSQKIESVISIIDSVSFKGGNGIVPNSTDGKIVQDADRLDALGAIGIARTFIYSGSKGQAIYNPSISVRENMSFVEYRSGKSTAINHFYEKLLKLKNLINTQTAKIIAEERTKFMELFLEQFLKEWNFINN
ncbi:MAG: phosphohydrolase [Bacillales bacterium]|jgi:uncharacterized protein|nr:phosphohydrolase [Bacillales bacterium]